MRPNLEYNNYSFNGQANSGCLNGENKNCTTFFVSSNVYYGYHRIPTVAQQRTQNVPEQMEVEVQHNSDVQFNNLIPLDERLCDHNINRKRPFEYESDYALAPINAFKKRRETGKFKKTN